MKKLIPKYHQSIPFLIFILFHLSVFAQEVVYDPQHCATAIENATVRSSAERTHNNYLKNIKNKLSNINVNMGTLVLAQTIIFNALSDVNSALKDGIAVKNMSYTLRDMLRNISQAMSLAQEQPYLLLFVNNTGNEMLTRAISLFSDVSAFILSEGGDVLADYNSRDQMLRRVIQQLNILDGMAYGAWRAMYWAKERGLLASLNPYAGWISKDINYANQIILNAKYLRQ